MAAFGAAAQPLTAKGTASPHGDLDIGCGDCHTAEAWSPLRDPLLFEHRESGFDLLGAHADTSCRSCHPTLVFSVARPQCVSCHEPEFTRASAPDHRGFPTTCESCHGSVAWKPASFDHAQTAFSLRGAHRAVECAACHAQGFAGTPTDCFSCHQSDFNAATQPRHTGFPNACQDCHGEAAWQPATFDHGTTAFPLRGAHRTADCASCHRTGFAGTPNDCFSCHQSDFNAATQPRHTGFPNACQDCHGEAAWQPATFDHGLTSFPLRGAHRSVDCASCHRSGYAGTPSDCFSCHQSDFNAATQPRHTGFPNACQDCHGEAAWQPATFDHALTSFPLRGAHRSVDCASCHRSGYAGTPSDCFSCHQSDFNAATQPRHTGFPNACQDCHGEAAWQPATFDHALTSFPLRGAHRSVDCASCHRSGYAGTPSDCFSCHQSDFTAATQPRHTGFPNACQDCHGEAAWQPATFDHALTSFPLRGAHRSVDCASCHRSGYAGTPSDCFSCHQADFTAATNPRHTGFPTACQSCHGEAAWQPASFDHNSTSFPLRGAHQAADCTSCHRSGYAGTPTDCFSCHQNDFTGATNPRHTGFPTACQSCHGEAAWEPASFDHNTTSFPLRGAHRAADCTSCHRSGYDGTPTDCFSCHQADFTGATQPRHTGFPTACQSCHGEAAWHPASFDHNATSFPLRGAHQAVACLDCHASGYNGTPTDCFSCHQADFTGADDPPHTGFPTTCQSCHGESAWEPASFNHNNTSFPLTGAHRNTPCADCHASGYNGTPTDCFSCHQADYNGTNEPDHRASGFPTTCQTCHSTNAWEPSTWNHDPFFPISSGRHRLPCSDCHITPGQFQTFECIYCHEHNRQETDNEHDEVGGYTYVSQACYQCHPRGSH
ncbi:MAG TPA: hypothetical protein VF017_12265 [Thermoanaerobaculia bacterium]|nr:hypothetical protein [Thermoanaerobaculia bacterium]